MNVLQKVICIIIIISFLFSINPHKVFSKEQRLYDYVLVEGKDLEVYKTNYKNIDIIYSSKEQYLIEGLKKYLDILPNCITKNIKEIVLIPYSNNLNIAGSTKDGKITLYNFKKYQSITKENIIYHEATHTWAKSFIENKNFNDFYGTYKEYVDNDNNYVSNYSKEFSNNNNGKLSEDFADAVAFYLIDNESFKEKFPNRTIFINGLLNTYN